MTFEVPERIALIQNIEHLIPIVLKKLDTEYYERRWDRIAYPSGIKRSIALRDRRSGSWYDNWTLHLRHDGKLTLVYHRTKIVKAIVVRVTKPFQQRAFGISLRWIWKYLPLQVLGRVCYLLDDATGDPYAGYGYPIWAFAPPQNGRG